MGRAPPSRGQGAGTINHGLKIVRRILRLAASDWVDQQGLTWLPAPPKIKLLPDLHKRRPYPLGWEEQARLFGGSMASQEKTVASLVGDQSDWLRLRTRLPVA